MLTKLITKKFFFWIGDNMFTEEKKMFFFYNVMFTFVTVPA